MTNENILLVGSTGTVGYPLANLLARNNIMCRCLVRNKVAAAPLASLGMTLVEGDLTNPKSLDEAVSSVEKVFLCSPLSPDMSAMQINLAQAAQSAGVKHFVKVSTLAANPNSKMLFAKWHGEVEQAIKDMQLPYTFLRPHYFMQNTLSFKQAILSASAIFVPMHDAKISLIDSDDVARVAASVLTSAGHENKTYDLTGPQSLSFKDIASEFSSFYNKPVEFLTLPKEISEKTMQEAGAPQWLTQGTSDLFEYLDKGDAAFVRTTVSDITRQPATSFKQFLHKFATYLKG